jgi:hypothetical protein
MIKHNAAVSKRSVSTNAYVQRYIHELNTGLMDGKRLKEATKVKYGLEKDDQGVWYTTLKTEEMRCIDDCKKGGCKDTDDTKSVASMTDAEIDKFIRDASNKVLKVENKTTKAKKKMVEKVIEEVVDKASNKRVRKVPVRFKAK